MDEKTLELRLNATRAAQERSRYASISVLVISLAMMTAGWNAYFSYYKDVAADFASLTVPSPEEASKGKNLEGTKELEKRLLAEWVSSRMVHIPIIGIKIGVDDAPTAGALAMLVALLWQYVCVRRENFTIGLLIYDTKDCRNSVLKWRVFHGIDSYTVFTNVRSSDNPFQSSQEVPKDHQITLLHWMTSALCYLPFAALALIITLDIISLFQPATFRDPDRLLISILCQEANHTQIFELVMRWVISAILSIFVFLMCWRIGFFAKSTEKVLKEYLEVLEKNTQIENTEQNMR